MNVFFGSELKFSQREWLCWHSWHMGCTTEPLETVRGFKEQRLKVKARGEVSLRWENMTECGVQAGRLSPVFVEKSIVPWCPCNCLLMPIPTRSALVLSGGNACSQVHAPVRAPSVTRPTHRSPLLHNLATTWHLPETLLVVGCKMRFQLTVTAQLTGEDGCYWPLVFLLRNGHSYLVDTALTSYTCPDCLMSFFSFFLFLLSSYIVLFQCHFLSFGLFFSPIIQKIVFCSTYSSRLIVLFHNILKALFQCMLGFFVISLYLICAFVLAEFNIFS